MSAELVIAGYVRIAKQDLDGARLLNTGANRNAAYLCEQAAEKLIRAVLTSEGIQAGNRHELPDMVATIPDANPVKPLLRGSTVPPPALGRSAKLQSRTTVRSGDSNPRRQPGNVGVDRSIAFRVVGSAAKCCSEHVVV